MEERSGVWDGGAGLCGSDGIIAWKEAFLWWISIAACSWR